MAEILVSVPGCIGFGGVIALATAAGWCVSGEDGRADLEMKNDVAFEAKCASFRLSRDPNDRKTASALDHCVGCVLMKF